MMGREWQIVVCAILFVSPLGCGSGNDSDGDADTDADGDTDPDPDRDGDANTDEDGGSDADADPDVDAEPDADPDIEASLTPPPEGRFEVGLCAGIDRIDEACVWTYQFDDTVCTAESPCSKLVIFFSGGEMSCGYEGILSAFAEHGYVATCAQIFETSEAAGAEPYNDEAPRVDLLIWSITSSPEVRAVWTGEDLLISGVSHGATAPVIAMARTVHDSEWLGSRFTAACFFDGIYNIGVLDEFLGTSGVGGSPCNLVLSHARAVGRYYDRDPLAHSCVNDMCACDPDASSEMSVDTITGVGLDRFAIADWKLIECGSAMNACLQDVVPSAPIRTLCNRLETDSGHSCAWDPMPESSHVACASEGIDRCYTWFDDLLAGL